MTVYFIRAGEAGPVKIGFTRDIDARLRALQCAAHEKLRLIRQIVGGGAVEKWMHRRFSEHRIRAEWFHFSEEMLSVEPPSDLPLVADGVMSPRLVRAHRKSVERA